jgi:pimeloyl-ACP methyl ester carboxylesterase
MQVVPDIRYAKAGDVRIAYQEFGEGAVAIVLVPGSFVHIETSWDVPDFAKFWRRLAAFGRIVIFDKWGTGLSDRIGPGEWPTLEERTRDVLAVMDAVGLEKAAIMAAADGGPVAAMFAAAHPERTKCLLLYGTSARLTQASDFPIGIPGVVVDALLEGIDERWGNDAAPFIFEQTAPSWIVDPEWRRLLARLQRRAASPSAAASLMRVMFETDVRALLPMIRVPTLVLHVKGDQLVPIDHGRYLAERIPDARFIEFDGSDHLFLHENGDAVADAIQEFLTGSHSRPDVDRVLVTILFTDIVESTSRVAELGDHRWRGLLETYREHAHQEVTRHRGREIDFAGDGLLAIFDGPARAVRCAAAIRERVRPLNLAIRAGVHTGEVELMEHGIAGISVHVGARIMALAAPDEILVSNTVKDLVAGSAIAFDDHGVHALKGIAERWQIFSARC